MQQPLNQKQCRQRTWRALSVTTKSWRWKSLHKALIAFFALISLTILSACSGDKRDTLWHDYLLSLNIQSPEQPAPFPVMPRGTDLRLHIEPFRISLLTGLRLDRCRLGQLVAEQNSTLGQTRSPSARLRYELDSLIAIEECLLSPVANTSDTARLLNDAMNHKLTTLPLYIDQALTRSDEMRTALRPATAPLNVLSEQNQSHFTETIAALQYLLTTFQNAQQQQFSDIDLHPYNAHFRTLAQNDFLPHFLRTMQHTSTWLNQANIALAALNEGNCEKLTEAEKLYSTAIHTILVHQIGYQQQLQPVLAGLTEFSTQDRWRHYLAQLGQISAQFTEHANAHIKHWQQRKESCGF